MNASEHEWNALSELWQTSIDPIDDGPVRRMVAAHRRRLIAIAAGEIALVIGFLLLSWLVMADGLAAWEAAWLATLWSFVALAAAFAWWNRRGMWRAMGTSVDEYARQRVVRRMRSMRFAARLFLAELLVVVAELTWFDRFTVPAVSTLSAATLVMGFWYLWMRRRMATDLQIGEAANT